VSALVLLALNLWFVIKVLSVLRAVQDGLILLARWLNIAREPSFTPGRSRTQKLSQSMPNEAAKTAASRRSVYACAMVIADGP
jgi:hypothetical protein